MLSAFDLDLVDEGHLKYSITTADMRSLFTMSPSGILQKTCDESQTFDRETHDVHILTVQVEDSDGFTVILFIYFLFRVTVSYSYHFKSTYSPPYKNTVKSQLTYIFCIHTIDKPIIHFFAEPFLTSQHMPMISAMGVVI